MSYSPTPFKEGNGKDTEREKVMKKRRGKRKRTEMENKR